MSEELIKKTVGKNVKLIFTLATFTYRYSTCPSTLITSTVFLNINEHIRIIFDNIIGANVL